MTGSGPERRPASEQTMSAPERASPLDLMQLSTDAGQVPNQVAAVLRLDATSGFDLAAAQQLIGARLDAVPRLRQRLTPTPFGGGRPIWVDDPRFDLAVHVTAKPCPAPGDEASLLGLAAQVVTTPLASNRPRWSATFVTGLAHDEVALVLVFHHVLADGLGGLTALSRLVDGEVVRSVEPFPRPPPSRRALRRDAMVERWRSLRRLRATGATLRAGSRELSVGRPRLAPRTSLNRPTGPHRRLALARADLAAARTIAHANGATVNDLVLTVVAGASRTLLAHRGEDLDELVVSVPVAPPASVPREGDRARPQLGNRVGVIPVRLPTRGEPEVRLRAIAAITHRRKGATRGASGTVLAPMFRLLGALHLLRPFIDHQRLVNTFVTDLAGPPRPITFGGRRVTDVFAVSLATGNATVAFAVLSYAGVLTITVVADPERVPDLPVLVDALQDQLDALTTPGGSVSSTSGERGNG
jgi:diacylglycerol O-acyltransferase / wax synthase